MLIRLANGRATFLDFRERAPASAHRDMYLDKNGDPTADSVVGYRAAGVPGTVRGLAMALNKYGTKSWPSMVEPAIRLAGEGVPVTWDLARSLRTSGRLGRFPESRRIFLDGGRYFELGDTLKQQDLAVTLERLARHGPDEFYSGETARLIARDMAANGGTITEEDLAAYSPVERKPVTGSYRGPHDSECPPSQFRRSRRYPDSQHP